MKKTPLHPLRSAKRKLSSFAIVALAAIVLNQGTSSHLYAVGLTWDVNPGTAGQQDGPGTWNTSNNNWLNGASNVSWVNGDDALIGGGAGSSINPLSLQTNIIVANLAFGNAGSGQIVISSTTGNTLTVTGTMNSQDGNGSSITANTFFTNGLNMGSTTVGGVVENGGSTITLSGSSSVTGNIAVSNGTLKLTGTESGATNINVSGGTLTLGGSSAITGSVNVTGGTLDLTTAGYSSTGWVNINDSNGVIKVTGNSLPSFSGTFGLSGGSLRTTGTYVGALGTGAGQLQITGGALSGNGGGASAGTFNFTVGGTAGGTMVWGVGGFTPTTNFNFGVTGPNGNTTLLNAIDLNVASGTTTRTISFGGNGTAFQVLAGNIINSGSATGVANLTLTAANGNTQNNNLTTFVISGSDTYNGATVFNGGARYQLGTGSNSALTNTTSISLTGNAQFAIDISGTTAISAPISSPGGSTTSGYQSLNNPGITVMTIGPGTVILTGSSSYTGGTLVGAGVLQIGNGGTSGFIPTTSAVSGSAGATLAYDLSSNTTASGTISGALGLSQIGGGVLTLNGGANQSYTGATTIAAASTLQLGDGVNDGSISSSGTVANSGTLIFNNASLETYTGMITGGGSIIKNNTGTQKISGSNNYTGSTTVNLGVLQLGSAAALGNTSNLSVGTSGTVNFSNGSTTQTTTLSGSGTTLTLAGGSVITGSGANASGSGGSTLIFGVGNGVADQLVLTGGATLSLTGTTTIQLAVSGTGVSNFTIISSGTGLGASLEPGGSGAPSFILGALPSLTAGSLTQSATSIQLTFSAINTVYWTGGNANPAAGWNTPGSPGANFTSDAAGNDPLNAMFGIAQDVIFSASNQSFQNATLLDGNVSAHSLTISSAGAVGIGSGTVSSTLTLAGASGVTGINTGSNAGAVTISANVTFATAATPNITVMNAAGLTISGTIGGSGGLLVNGTNLLTLTGNNNFTGGLSLVSGTTNFNSDGALGASTGSVTFNPGSGSNAVLQAATSLATGSNRNFVFSTGTGTIDTQANTLTINGLISGGAAFNKVGAGTLVLTGNNTGFSGVATASSGTLQIQNPAWLGVASSGTFNTAPGGTLNLVLGGLVSYLPAHVVTFGGNGNLLLTGTGVGNQLEPGGGTSYALAMTGGTIEIGSGVRWENGGPAGGGPTWVGNLSSMQIDASGTFDPWDNSSAAAPINIDALNGSGQINRSGFGTGGAWVTMGVNGGSGTFGGNILNSLGTVSITKTGAGTQVFSGSNGYSGFTAVTGGTLRVTTANGLGFGDQTFVSVGGVSDHTTTVSGSATLDLSAAGTINNAVTLNNGSLINSSTSAATTLDSGIAGVTFSVDPGVNSPITFGTSGGSGTGFSGTAATNGNNMYVQVLTAGTGYTPGAGAPTVTLTQSGGGVGGTVTAVVSSLSLTGTNNSIGGAGNLIINAQISGTGGFSKVGNGTLTVSGSNIYSGTTTITQGNLSVTNTAGSATGSAGVNLNAAAGSIATLSGNGFIAGAVVTSATSASVGVAHLAPGVNTSGANNNFGTQGVLTLSNGLTIGNGTNLDYDLGPSSDLISVTGNLSLGSNIVLNYQSLGGSLVGNTAYDLINFSGTLLSGSAVLSSWTANGTGPTGTTSTTFAVSGTMITVTFNVALTTPAVAYWQGAQGASGTGAWNTVTSGSTNFTTDATGTNNTQVIPGSVTNVKFTANSGTNLNTVLGQNFTINSLEFTGAGTTAATTPVTIGGTNTLTISASGTNGNTAGNGITVDAGSAAHTISSNVALGSSQTWTVNGNPLTVSGTVSDGGNNYGLTKSGTGRLIVSAGETYTGATSVGAGTLEVDGSLSGSSAVTVGVATLSGTGNIGGSVALTGTSNLSSAGTLTVASLGVSSIGNTISSGTVDATGGTTLNTNSGLAVNGTLEGTVSIGSGATLTGTGTVTAGVTVGAGGITSPGGTAPGVMTTDLAYSASSTANFNVAISGSAGVPQAQNSHLFYSQIIVTGTTGQVSLAIGNNVTLGANSALSIAQTGSQIQGDGSSNSGVTLQLTISSSDYATLLANKSTNYSAKSANTGLDNYFVFNLGTTLSTGRFTTLDIDVSGVNTSGTIYYATTANDRFAADGVGNTVGDVYIGSQEFALSYTGVYGTNSTIGGDDIVLTAIPEPGTWRMILGGFGMLIGFQRLRKRRVGT